MRWCVAIENEDQVISDFPDPIHSGIVADEMGLGKTLQMVGLIVANIRHHTLIVLPRALLGQWSTALQNLLGHTAFVYHGQKARTQADLLQTAPVVITTYGTLAAEMSRPKAGKLPRTTQTGLLGVVWDRVIFDEAHRMRNKATRVHRAAAALQAQLRFAIHVYKREYVARINKMWIVYLWIDVPDFRPVPGFAEKHRGDIPERIAVYYNVAIRVRWV